MGLGVDLQYSVAAADDKEDIVELSLQKAHGPHLAIEFNDGPNSSQRLLLFKLRPGP